jgi:hypothetical protein
MCVDGVGIHLGVGRQGLEFVADVEQFVQHEMHVAQGGGVLAHGRSPRDYSWAAAA